MPAAFSRSIAPPAVCTPPQIANVSGTRGGGISLAFNSLVGLNYRVEYKNTLNDAFWTPLGATITATGVTTTATDSIGANPMRFYRVVCLQ